MIINLDETIISDRIVECIINGILECTKSFIKIAFVGVCKKEQRKLGRIKKETGIIIAYFEDYEKAKEWVLKKG